MDYVRAEPLLEGFELTVDELVLPLSVDEIFKYFFQVGSAYHFDEALKDLGDVFDFENLNAPWVDVED